jgi:hypothetical protein
MEKIMPLDSRRCAAVAARVVFDAHALHDIDDEETELVGPVVVAGGLTLVRGEVGLGKSWLALSVAQAAAGGHAVLGWRAARACRVLFVDGGLRLSALAARARAVAAGIGACAAPNLQVVAAAHTPLPDLGSEDGLAAMEAMLPERLDLLVLDGVVAPLGAGRGATQRVQRLAQWIEGLRRRGIAVLLTDGPRRAVTAVLDERADTVLALARPHDYVPDEGARVALRFAVARGLSGPAVRRCEARLAVGEGGGAAWERLDPFEAEAEQALVLRGEGLSYRAIARAMRLPSTTVFRMLGRLKGRATDISRGTAEHPAPRPGSREQVDDVHDAEAADDEADQHQRMLRRQHADQPARQRRRDRTADDEAEHDAAVAGEVELGEERDRDRHRHEELGEVDRADRAARLVARCDQGRGHQRAPAAAADRIEKAAAGAEHGRRRLPVPPRAAEHAHEDQHRHQRQVDRDDGLDDVLRQTGQHVRADHAARDAGDDDLPEQAEIHVAVPDMRGAGDAGRHHLGRVDGRTRRRRRRAEGDQARAGDDAEGHAERAVDQLRKEADRREQQDVGLHGAPPRRPRSTHSAARGASFPAPRSGKRGRR